MTNTADNMLFGYTPITDRARINWPGGARVAAYIGLNVEHFLIDRPSTSIWPGTADLVPDALNYGWRDYGPRVGIWRMIESLDRYRIGASALVNSMAATRYPQIIKAGTERSWAWLAHGQANSILHAGMTREEERRALIEITDTITAATGQRPKGWMGPGLTETFDTPGLLADLGYSYVLDWTNDDQPYPLNVPGMLSVPYSVEVNDLMLSARGITGPEFVQIIEDQYEQLRSDAASGGRVMALALHPFVTGQAFRAKYFDQALEFLSGQSDIWLTTSDEIAGHYRRTVDSALKDRAPAQPQ